MPPIEPGPQQNLQNVQAHHQNHDLHQEHCGTREAGPVSASCEVISSPMDQRAYPGTLEAKRKRHQNCSRTGLEKKAHRPSLHQELELRRRLVCRRLSKVTGTAGMRTVRSSIVVEKTGLFQQRQAITPRMPADYKCPPVQKRAEGHHSDGSIRVDDPFTACRTLRCSCISCPGHRFHWL
jgi:hypothetical protein